MRYDDLVSTYLLLEKSSKRLDKTYHLAQLLKRTDDIHISLVLRLVQGKIFPEWDNRKLGVAARIVLKAINITTGISLDKLEQEWKNTGDLGNVASTFVKNKVQATLFSDDLTIKKVHDNLVRLADMTGAGTVDYKVKLICELLSNAKPDEARFIVRTILEELRVGIGEGTIKDAIAWSIFPIVVGIFYKCQKCKTWMPNVKKCIVCNSDIENKFKKEFALFKDEDVFSGTLDDVQKLDNLGDYRFILTTDEVEARKIYDYFIDIIQQAYHIRNDFGEVASAARKGISELDKFELTPGLPIKVMLAQKVKDVKEGFERVGKPCAIEFKYDGFRLQCHKSDGKITLFTRRLENVTKQFPDVVEYLMKHIDADEFIIDSEAVGFNPKTTQYLPFQFISQRIKRKYDTEALSKKIPVELNIFDIMFLDGKNLINHPFEFRRKQLARIVDPIERKIVLSRIRVTEDEGEAQKFYSESLDSGNEGIMLKKLDAIYKPGSRVGFMIKLKPIMESLDLAITGATWGEGKRSAWLTSFTVSCINEDGEFLEIGKVGTGIKELEGEGVTFAYLTELLKPLITAEKGKDIKVKPEVVVEINYEEIQKSTNYSSGYALRFPRLKVLREERSAEDISDLDMVEELFFEQKKR